MDLRPACPPVYSQGQPGSGTANAIAGALEFGQQLEELPTVFTPSRLFIYYNERAIEGTIDSDSGAQIRDGIQSVATLGAPPETLWPYVPSEFAVRPPSEAFQAALGDTALLSFRLNRSLDDFRGCLASGYPFVFGFTVYESFESPQVAASDHASLPSPGEGVVGGHAVLAVGYDDASQGFLVRNSWGASWGLGGYFTLPYAYLCCAPGPSRAEGEIAPEGSAQANPPSPRTPATTQADNRRITTHPSWRPPLIHRLPPGTAKRVYRPI